MERNKRIWRCCSPNPEGLSVIKIEYFSDVIHIVPGE